MLGYISFSFMECAELYAQLPVHHPYCQQIASHRTGNAEQHGRQINGRGKDSVKQIADEYCAGQTAVLGKYNFSGSVIECRHQLGCQESACNAEGVDNCKPENYAQNGASFLCPLWFSAEQ